jgi:hypothetical protein
MLDMDDDLEDFEDDDELDDDDIDDDDVEDDHDSDEVDESLDDDLDHEDADESLDDELEHEDADEGLDDELEHEDADESLDDESTSQLSPRAARKINRPAARPRSGGYRSGGLWPCNECACKAYVGIPRDGYLCSCEHLYQNHRGGFS